MPPALPRSEADPTGFQPLRSSPCFVKRRLLNRQGNAQLWGHPRLVKRSRTKGGGEERLLASDGRAASVASRSRPQEALF